ncbi:MAG: T9SS type A sorting domain-containing protein [Flavobacteriales bacterium]|nr:T9SS type A sorting domain-containing protein [Flavobacteriales bacterium]MCB9448554.1 T9SS type A sorting domain-containing protein [Flavobacteriales bacterium]
MSCVIAVTIHLTDMNIHTSLPACLLSLTLFTTASAQTVSTFLNNTSVKVDDAMVLDAEGNLYGSNYAGTNVYKITPDGNATIFATGFNTPNGLAFDSQQHLYVADMSGNHIYKLSHDGKFLDTIAVPNPSGIIKSFDSDTMIFTQYQSYKLNKLAPDGTIIPMFSSTPLNGPVGLAYDDAGTLFVANFNNREIFRVSDGSLEHVATIPGSGWLGFITYAHGFLWATAFSTHKIYQIYPYQTDSVTLFAGSTAGNTDGHVGIATFNGPNGIIASASGDSLYVSEYNTGHIRVITDLFTGIRPMHDQRNNLQLVAYPNPSQNFITVRAAGTVQRVEVMDLRGRVWLLSNETSFPVVSLQPGTYVLRALIEDEWVTSVFVKK